MVRSAAAGRPGRGWGFESSVCVAKEPDQRHPGEGESERESAAPRKVVCATSPFQKNAFWQICWIRMSRPMRVLRGEGGHSNDGGPSEAANRPLNSRITHRKGGAGLGVASLASCVSTRSGKADPLSPHPPALAGPCSLSLSLANSNLLPATQESAFVTLSRYLCGMATPCSHRPGRQPAARPWRTNPKIEFWEAAAAGSGRRL